MKVNGKSIRLSTMISLAINAGACGGDIEKLRRYSSIEDVLKNVAASRAAYWAYWYARDVIEGRWPEAESVISKSPYVAYRYAINVLRGRWPEAESVISKDPRWAYCYARDVIKRYNL